MKTIGRTILALGLALAMAASAAAEGLDPVGVWVAEKNSDYKVSRCGPGNADLCFELVALRNNMDNTRNRPYLNTLIIDRARSTGQNRWKGRMSLGGQSGDATIVLRGGNDLRVKVCAMIVVCQEYAMTRVE